MEYSVSKTKKDATCQLTDAILSFETGDFKSTIISG